MEHLYGRTLSELEVTVKELSMPRFAAKQLARWLYRHGVGAVEQMTDISAVNRQRLAERFDIGLSQPLGVAESSDGTRKYLYATADEISKLEAVYIPDGERATLCVSSQAGCRMGCRFCMTARQGLHHSLSTL